MIEFLVLLFKLLIAHAVADFSLQPDAMAKGKNRHTVVKPPPGQKLVNCWPYWMSAHAFVHGGAVYIATGLPLFGAIETAVHFLVDFVKCENATSPHVDQLLHFIPKVVYCCFIYWYI